MQRQKFVKSNLFLKLALVRAASVETWDNPRIINWQRHAVFSRARRMALVWLDFNASRCLAITPGNKVKVSRHAFVPIPLRIQRGAMPARLYCVARIFSIKASKS